MRNMYCVIVVMLMGVWDVHGSGYEIKLINDLIMTNYTPLARPALNDNDSVILIFGLTLRSIVGLNEKEQTLTVNAWLRQMWENPTLKWDPEKYNGIKSINIEPKYVWKPDLVLYNNADEDKSYGGNLDRMNTRVTVNYNGSCKWLAPAILKSGCDINVRWFPFDTQNCTLKFGSWTYDKARMNLSAENTTADLESFSKSTEWRLDSADGIVKEGKYTCCPELYQTLTYSFVLRRRSLFFLLNLIFPMAIIGLLTMFTFLLPEESGERIGLSITLLLALTVFMLIVNDIIPSTSDAVPLVAVFFNASLVEMIILILCLCYSTRLYHKDSTEPPMPKWMRRYILDWLSYKLRIRVQEDEGDDDVIKNNIALQQQQKQNGGISNGHANNGHLYDNPIMKTSSVNGNNVTPDIRKRQSSAKRESSFGGLTENELILIKLDAVLAKIHNQEDDDNVQTEWVIVARTIDFCLLITFLTLYILTILGWAATCPGYVV